MTFSSLKLAAAAATAIALTVGAASAAPSQGSFEATLQIKGKDICTDLSGLQSSGNSGSATYVFTGVDPTTGLVTATGNTATISLADSGGGTVLCTGPTDKRVYITSANGGLVPDAGVNVDDTLFASKVTYNVTGIDWGPDTFTTKDLPQASADLTSRKLVYTKKGAAQGNVEVSLELDASTLPLIATTYEDVLTITVTDDLAF